MDGQSKQHLSEEDRSVHTLSASQEKAADFMQALWWELEVLEEVWDALGGEGCTSQRDIISACFWVSKTSTYYIQTGTGAAVTVWYHTVSNTHSQVCQT